MNGDALKLTTYFGERDRANGTFLADALIDLYARNSFQASVLLRGIEGFGIKHHLRTDRLLTLSEDLPIVSVAIDTRARIEAALDDVINLSGHGPVTLERAMLIDGTAELPTTSGAAAKLTLYVGRQARLDGRPAYLAIVDELRDCGVDGATVLLGVDGTSGGVRQRATFLGANSKVPLMIIAVGAGDPIARAAGRLAKLLPDPPMTLERVRICKRDGQTLESPHRPRDTDASGLGVWQKLMVFSGEQSRHDGRPLHTELIRSLRDTGASGATALRGVWGYHGDHHPHGDSLWRLRRRVPIVTTIVETPTRIVDWYEIVDRCTDETGLVTSELVPAFQASGPDLTVGGLRLARP